MKKRETKVNLFHYLDYRKFLRDYYEAAKKSRGSFSFRTFSKQAGFTSPNFYKLVMDGERNLTEESLTKFMVGLKLNKQEQDFFRHLVFFNQAASHEQKNFYYQKLLQSRKFNQIKPIEKGEYEFYSTWYHPVVRELIVSKECDGSPEWVAARIEPPVSVNQVKKSIELLEKLGFISKEGQNGWKQSTPLVSTGAESGSLVLLNYHQNLLDLVKNALPQIQPEKRDVSALTLGVVKERIPQLKKKIQEFREEILKMVSTDEHPDEVVILGIQMLPVTKKAEEPNR